MPNIPQEDIQEFEKLKRMKEQIEREHFIMALANAIVNEIERRRDC